MVVGALHCPVIVNDVDLCALVRAVGGVRLVRSLGRLGDDETLNDYSFPYWDIRGIDLRAGATTGC